MKKLIQKIIRGLGYDLRRYQANDLETFVVSLSPKSAPKGHVLLSYIVEPYLEENASKKFNNHTHYWESGNIADIFLEMGYMVDVIGYHNITFIPRKDYSIFVGARTNFERLSKLLNKGCLKIVHLDTSHWAFNNHASYNRLLSLVKRRGVAVKGSLRLIEENLGIEYADCATILGNQFTVETYQYAQKPIFRIPISTCGFYPWDDNKDFGACSRNFLWFGSAGAVHRGLDLLLETFSEMPDYHLYICGPIDKEMDFIRAYHREMYETENIHMLGWQDVNSPQFELICGKCIGLIYPTCAEGGGGAVINCMHAGLIPIVSYESSVDIGDFGVILKESSIAEIKSSVQMLSTLPAGDLKQRAKKSWEFARKHHTREKFSHEFKKAIKIILDRQP
jgi:hypothetical protein